MAECHGGGFCLGNYLIRMICWWHFCFVFMLYKKQRCNLRREDTLNLIPNEGKKPANEAQANRKTIGTKYRPTAQAHWTTTLLHWLPSPTSVHSPSALIQELRKRRKQPTMRRSIRNCHRFPHPNPCTGGPTWTVTACEVAWVCTLVYPATHWLDFVSSVTELLSAFVWFVELPRLLTR